MTTFIPLLAVGGALVVFGAVVLIRFPDRPGGRIAWRGMEVSSVGAGLPVIVLGVFALAFAAVRAPGDSADGRDPGTPGGSDLPGDAKSATRKLLDAWRRGHRDDALEVARASAVDELLDRPFQRLDSTQLTCYVVGSGQRGCEVPASGGGNLSFKVFKSDEGWWVEDVEFP